VTRDSRGAKECLSALLSTGAAKMPAEKATRMAKMLIGCMMEEQWEGKVYRGKFSALGDNVGIQGSSFLERGLFISNSTML